MKIHHAQIKKAEKLGFSLMPVGDLIEAYWPKHNAKIYGVSVAEAITQMIAAQSIITEHGYSLNYNQDPSRLVSFFKEDQGVTAYDTPHAILHSLQNPIDNKPTLVVDRPKIDRSAAGIALNGALAYKEGTPSGDCPFSSEDEDSEDYDKFLRWNEEWDAAADEVFDEVVGGSVVSSKYRALYAEAGHPTHCGDWLANTLNDICANKAGTNLELFELICSLNGVDTSKYKRDGVGWQGRIRMTGRNMVARKVFDNDGLLVLPNGINGGSMQAPADWMATRKFKKRTV
jgi:hypothetical protein